MLSRGGGLGLVSTATRRLELIDPFRRRRLARAGFTYRWSMGLESFGDLSREGELLHGRSFRPRLTHTAPMVTQHLRLVDAPIDLGIAARRAFFDRSEQGIAAITVREQLAVGVLEADTRRRERSPVIAWQSFEPLPRKMIQAADLDLDAGLVAAATFGRVAAMDTASMSPPMSAETVAGDTLWLAVGGRRIAAIAAVRELGVVLLRHEIAVFELDAARRLESEPIYRATHRGGSQLLEPVVADFSDDGRYLAVALRSDEIAVHDIERGAAIRLDGHTDAVSALRFGPGASHLVSGDFDNRVIVRRRGPRGFATRLEPAAYEE
jgi:hypothetical protein